MTLSVVVPTYNQADYIAETLQSLVDQTVIPLEVIVVNDGSTDKTAEVLKEFPFKVVTQVNKGLASARNTGIMHAKGDYVFFLDSDDLALENCVEKLIYVMEQTGADIVAPSMKVFGTQNQDVVLSELVTLNGMKKSNLLPYCCAVKKEALLDVGGYSPRMWWGYEDYALWVNMLRVGKTVVTMQEPLVLYRTKEQSMYTEAVKHHEELIGQIVFDNQSVYA